MVPDVFNIGNQPKAVDYDQLHYATAERTSTNSNYRKVTQYQAPLRARLGMILGF